MPDGTGTSESQTLAGRYELGEVLGHGGMATVRDAVDRRLNRPVAVKLLRADLAEQPRARRRFETEAHAAARLSHPHVVTVFDSGEDNGIPFLVMERLPGRTLADEISGGALRLARAREVGLEILSALASAHAAGIIHRDIKPGNVLLTEDEHVKVADFGIAKTADELDQTQTTELLATPGYLAPERLAGEPATQRSDLYSVGVLLYEALSGRRPFAGDSAMAMMRAIEEGKAEPLSTLMPKLPADVTAAIERAMSRDPADRFADAREMAAALDGSANLDATVPVDTFSGADTVPVRGPAHDGATQMLQVERQPAAAVRDPRRRARLITLLIVAAVAIALVAGIAVNRSSSGSPTSPLVRAKTSSPVTTTSSSALPGSKPLPAGLAAAIRRLEQAIAK